MSATRSPNSAPAGKGVHHVEVDEGYSGQRIDNFLHNYLHGSPRALIYRILRKGEVRVNRGRVRPEYRLQSGDIVRIPPVRLPERSAPQQAGKKLLASLEAAVLFENNDLLVLNKPAGMAVHGGSGINLGLIEALRQSRPREKQLELVHRLDRDTSGCLLVAKKRSALRFLQDALREHRISKHYQALVIGRWPKRKTVVDAPLHKFHLASGERMVKVSEEGKRSRTEFAILERYEGCTLVEARPITGRTHQIRVHAQSVGCPLVGDEKYNRDEINAQMKAQGFERLFLHAARLTFPLPPGVDGNDSGRLKTVDAPLPDDLADPLSHLAPLN